MKEKGEYIPIPAEVRFKSLTAFHQIMVVSALLVTPVVYVGTSLEVALGLLLVLFLFWAVPVGLFMWIYRRKFVPKPLTAEERAEAKKEDYKRWQRQSEIENFLLSRPARWTAAVALGWAAWELKDMAGHFTTRTNVAAIACAFMGLVAAYDVAIFIVAIALLIGIVALLSGAASNLTVTGAIIVGAVIIAWAILQTNKKRRDE